MFLCKHIVYTQNDLLAIQTVELTFYSPALTLHFLGYNIISIHLYFIIIMEYYHLIKIDILSSAYNIIYP